MKKIGVCSVCVRSPLGPQQGADQEHAGAGCAHEGGRQSAQRQKAGVDPWRGPEVPLDQDATGDDEEGT